MVDGSLLRSSRLLAVSRHYRAGTLVLETEFQTETGQAAIIDFMPPADGADLVRIVIGRSGCVNFHTEFVVRFNYGATVPWVNRLEDGTINAIAGPECLVLRTPVALHGEDLKTVGEFTVEAGQSVSFVLSYGASFQSPPPAINPFDALECTEAFWRQWSDRCPDVGPWSEAVERSLITLKAMTYAPTGGIVAAVTTSLPERLGGVRNWDYRYCWLRDATVTLLALTQLGYYDEAVAWRDWFVRAVAGSPRQIQIMYGVGGERLLPEWIASWLPGYENSAPVRIGNDASQQFQLDVFGELADSMFQAYKAGMKPTERGRGLRSVILDYLQPLGGNQTPAFGRCAAGRSTSFTRRSWPGLRSIGRRMSWRRKHSTNPGSAGARSPTKSMPKSVSAVSIAILTASFRPMAPSDSMPACC